MLHPRAKLMPERTPLLILFCMWIVDNNDVGLHSNLVASCFVRGGNDANQNWWETPKRRGHVDYRRSEYEWTASEEITWLFNRRLFGLEAPAERMQWSHIANWMREVHQFSLFPSREEKSRRQSSVKPVCVCCPWAYLRRKLHSFGKFNQRADGYAYTICTRHSNNVRVARIANNELCFVDTLAWRAPRNWLRSSSRTLAVWVQSPANLCVHVPQ